MTLTRLTPMLHVADVERSLAFYRDNTLDLFNEMKTRGLALGLPVTLLIDKEGCLLASLNGPAEWAGPDAKLMLASVK